MGTEPHKPRSSNAPPSRSSPTREELELELSRARAALAEARSRSDGFAHLSHEIRTLLNGVIGITGLLLDTNLTVEQRDYGKRIRSSGDALLGLLNNVLDFSKSEANMLAIDKVPFELSRTVEEVGELLSERAASKGLELVVFVDPAVPPVVQGDPMRLRQVLLNLVSNAIKFTDEGEVTVRAAVVALSPTDARVRFEVKDTGIGISDGAQRRLFQPFSQVHEGNAPGGSGLGLALAKRLVESMDGTVGVESRSGEGSTFFFDARFDRQGKGAVRAAIPRVDLAGRRVAVVDDSPSAGAAIRAMAEELDVEVAVFPSVAAALGGLAAGAAEGKCVDVVVVDLQLDAGGAEAIAERVRHDAALGAPRLVGLRTPAPHEPVSGLAVTLAKPVRRPQLHAALRTLMGGSIDRVEDRRGSSARLDRVEPPVDPSPRLAEPPPRPADPPPPGSSHRQSVVSMLRSLGQQPRPARAPSVTLPAPPIEPDERPRILLVEDNVVNQRVAVAMVSKRGYVVDVAQNGFEAIDATGKLRYAAVFMDCQMPKLDGYQTTQHIRKREAAGPRTPIIAMTANANAGDREKCLAAGMDDYVAKPVVAEELERVLRQWAPLPAAQRPPTGRRRSSKAPRRESKRPSAAPGPAPAIDDVATGRQKPPVDRKILERLRSVQIVGESDLVAEVIDLFLGELSGRIDILRAAAGVGDLEALGRTAHTLKGSAGQIGAVGLADLCGVLERGARARAPSFAPIDQVDAIAREADRVRLALDAERRTA